MVVTLRNELSLIVRILYTIHNNGPFDRGSSLLLTIPSATHLVYFHLPAGASQRKLIT